MEKGQLLERQPLCRCLVFFTCFPPAMTSPVEGVSSPAIRLRIVDFPHPEGPNNEIKSPSLMVRLISLNTCSDCFFIFFRKISLHDLIEFASLHPQIPIIPTNIIRIIVFFKCKGCHDNRQLESFASDKIMFLFKIME